jgi:serine protease AprX
MEVSVFRQAWVGKFKGQSGRWVAFAALFLLVLLAATYARPTLAGQVETDALAKIEPLVLQELASRGQTDYFIWLTEKADLSPAANLPTKEAKGQFVFDALTSTAESTQRELRAFLDGQGATYRPFYISNKILVRDGNEAMLMEVAGRADVAQITANHVFQLPEPFINPNPEKLEVLGIESNLTFINADDVWAMGYDGAGIVLAGNDTGLDWDHPALINNYRGWNGSVANHNYNWWDATGTYPTVPDDGHGHGTHTTGTMVGDDGGSNRIGVAPGAQTIHCKNMDNGGFGDDATFSECFEFDLAPWDLSQANPMPSLAPHAVNNSWGYPGGDQPQLQDEVDALQAAGILVEASAGNEGSTCASLRSPGDYAQALTTGSVNHAGGSLPGSLTGFSSRGPSGIHPGDFFPDIMAPGENINSSLPGGGYSGPTWSGTSMSGPHVVGLIGLMWEASPALIGDIDTTVQAIVDTAVPLAGVTGSNCGGDYTVGPNNDWGFGTIDALAAVNEGILQGGPGYMLEADPDTQPICTPTNAVYTVDVIQILGFDTPVDMSAQGHPGGTTANFSPDPVTPGNSTTLTIGNTGAAAAGSYDIDIIGTTATKTHTVTVGLDVYTASPGSVTLNSPANGATDVSLAPTYSWTAASQAGTYDIEVATDSGFTNIIYSATVEGTSHAQTTALDPVTTYYWHVRASNTCGDGGFSSTFSFTTRDVPPILLVDDDDNSPDVQATYDSALDGLGLDYDLWDTANSDTEPALSDLLEYDVVIWFTGDEFGGFAGPGSAGETALASWLDQDNCLFISSQDYHYDRGMTTFMTNYLGAGTITDDDGDYSSVTGTGSVFTGFGPYSLSYPFTDYSDPMTAGGSAELAFEGNNGSGAAVNKDSGTYRTTFWVFPWEAISTATDRQGALLGVLDFCAAGGGGLPSMDIDPDSFDTNLEEDQQTTETLSITNNGEADLEWSIYEDDGATGILGGGDWSDNFDSYATGSQLHGQGGWKGWFNDPNAGALLTDTPNVSAPNSVEVVGATDIVHEFTGYDSGVYTLTAWQYIPNDFSGETYFILLNTYDDTGATNNWSTQVNFSSAGTATNEGVTGGVLPLITGEWVEIRVEIDLDNDIQDFYYDGQLLFSGTWSNEVSGGGALNIDTIDLYANGASAVYYDNISIVAPPPATCEVASDIPWLSVSPDSGTTTPGSTSDVDVTFDSTGLAIGVYTGTLCIESNDPTNSLVQVPVTLNVTPDYGVDAMTSDADLPGQPGGVVTYTVEIHNTGEVTETYDLTLSGNTWMTHVEPESVTVAPGQSETVWVTVHIPEDATEGDTDTVTLTAASANTTDSLDLTTTATASGYTIYLPVIVRND